MSGSHLIGKFGQDSVIGQIRPQPVSTEPKPSITRFRAVWRRGKK
jgi:hypothetical protein